MTLSIITINYNNREGLQKTIDSVLAQTWKDYEWVVIDGGSTDGSRELIEQYQEHFAYWCSEPDKGVYNAMNKGIAKAQGDYINFMNSGDTFFESNTLHEVFAAKRTAEVLYGDWMEIYHDTETQRTIEEKELGNVIWHQNICHQSMFIQRKLFNGNGYDESMKLLADWYWNTKMYLSGTIFQKLTILVCRYDMYGMSREKNSINREECEKVMSLYPIYMQGAIRELDSYKNDRYVQITKELMEVNKFFAIITKYSLSFLFFIRLVFKRLIKSCHHKS